MTELLLRRAREAMPDAPAAATSLFIVGHGTDRHANSSSAAREQADRLRALGEFAEVFPAFLEEPPRIADWFTLATQPHVVVVPFFIADGLHGGEDIPALLGLDRNAPGPQHLHGRTISYTGAIGTDPLVADLIVEQAAAFR